MSILSLTVIRTIRLADQDIIRKVISEHRLRIKYAGTRSSQDATVMARDMHCEPEFIMKQPIGSFACFVGGMTEHPFTVELELGEIATYQKMESTDFDSLIDQLSELLGTQEPKQEVPPAHLFPDTREAAPAGTAPNLPAPSEAPAAVVNDPLSTPQNESDPSKPAKWSRK